MDQVSDSMTNQTTKTITFALVAIIAAVAWLGIAATTITPAHAGSASGNGAPGHTGACHKSLESTGLDHQQAVFACGPAG